MNIDDLAVPWRPIHRRLNDDDGVDYSGRPVHMAIVTDEARQRFKVLCNHGLGEWITGDAHQVTCPDCLEWVHA